MAWLNYLIPIIRGMVKVPGPLHFKGMLGWMIAETFLSMLTFSFPLSLLLWMHKPLRNLAYLGIFLIASRSNMLIFTFLEVSIISLFRLFAYFVSLCSRVLGADCLLLLDASAASLIYSAFSDFLLETGYFSSAEIGDYNSLPVLKVMALTLLLGLFTICEDNWPEPWDLSSLTISGSTNCKC